MAQREARAGATNWKTDMNDGWLQTSGALFQAVQLARVFDDSKTFPDCVPTAPPEQVEARFRALLADFVAAHFELPPARTMEALQQAPSLAAHIDRLWPMLSRRPDEPVAGASLLPLPNPYVVPGGRFREIYYWDSYFTAEGLVASGRVDLVEGMVRNFAWLIDRFGHVPNGNRSYFLGRSQPPTFCHMLLLLEREAGFDAVRPFLPQLEQEYRFWMRREPATYRGRPVADRRTVLVGEEVVLNRYWDDHNGPREESFLEDVELFGHAPAARQGELYRNLRAGAESGWDFSSRWLAEGAGLESIRTTELIPIDLNCLVYNIEAQLARWLARLGAARAADYECAAARRIRALNRLCWNAKAGWWFDFDWANGAQRDAWTLAGAFPIFCGLADRDQAAAMAANIEQRFLRPGGVVTTLRTAGEQWDAPNGWAPLQWVVVVGLREHGHEALAREIATRFVGLAERVHHRTGKLMEKYDVCDLGLDAGGGEYPVQDGFGWTNGVVRAFIERFGL